MKRTMTGHDLQFATQAIHAGESPDPVTGAHNPPLYQTVTYVFENELERESVLDETREGYVYTREGNPTSRMFERKLALLEGAEESVLTASGMGAIAATLLSTLHNGDHIVASSAIYPTAEAFIGTDLPALGINATFVDITNLASVSAAIRPETRVLYTEVLANPTLEVADIPVLAAIARAHDLILVVDNTFATPYLIRPLTHGADLVMHSATKYLSGHGDAVAGVVSGSADLIHPIRRMVTHLGSPVSPFNAWLLLRGIKTLQLRMDRHCQNAMRLAEYLQTRSEVECVRYPGLPNHPGHELATQLLGGRYGGMLSFDIAGGHEAALQFGGALDLCSHAVSLGDVSTLVWPWEEGNLIRVSVGIEAIDDLIADFDQAFQRIA